MFLNVFECDFIGNFILKELYGGAEFRKLFNLKFTFEHKKQKTCFVALLEKYLILFKDLHLRIENQVFYALFSQRSEKNLRTLQKYSVIFLSLLVNI